ncbi:hypothetical protein T10_6418 [Trichinella papuae]|uniref:Uncharacterized protein n=1 Tax=Trichinella papuae TaxID=268474 RepID=A0A0V1N256_9BILA|nr:hypothetical protein T10_6418 [Trichinella papuae]
MWLRLENSLCAYLYVDKFLKQTNSASRENHAGGHFDTFQPLHNYNRRSKLRGQQPEYNALRNCVISSFVQIKLNIRSVCEYKSRPSCSSSSRTNFKYVFHGKLFSSEVKAS